ncbi:MAG: hypothetical protein JNK78_05065 [Planctomycetes bacterium]|nr:hypothetical protein [Planctomycetota bacterium]
MAPGLMGRRAVAVAALTVLGLVVFSAIRWPAVSDSNEVRRRDVHVAVTAESGPLRPFQAVVAQRAGRASELMVETLAPLDRDTAGFVGSVSRSNWPGDLQRVECNLAEYCFFSMGKLDKTVLLRHPRLNPDDREVSASLVEDLDVVTKALDETQGPLAEAWSDLYREEAVALIDSGAVEPREGPRIDEATVSHLARIARQEGKYPGKSVAEVKDLLRANAIGLDGDAVVHRGEVYPCERFTKMPASDAAFEWKRLVAIQTADFLAAWFTVHALTQRSAAAADIESFAGTTRADLSKRGPVRR